MEIQKRLLKHEIPIAKKIADLDKLLNFFKKKNKYEKIVKYYGNVDSATLILVESPYSEDLNSKSEKIFCLDSINPPRKAALVINKIFKQLKLDAKNYLWDNVYKLPIQKLSDIEKEIHEKLILDEINLLNIKKIIIVGKIPENVFKKLDEKIEIKHVLHPSLMYKNSFNDWENYAELWRSALIKIR